MDRLPGRRRGQRDRDRPSQASRAARCWAASDQLVDRARQPGRERGQLQPDRHPGGGRRARRVDATWSRSPSPTRASASRAATWTGSSNGSTGSTRPAAAPPVAPASACRSSSTSPPTTAATCGSGASRARAPPSPCGCPLSSTDAGRPDPRSRPRTPTVDDASPRPPSRPRTHRRRPRDPSAGRRGRGVLQRRAGLHAAQGRLRGRRSRRPDRRRWTSSTGPVPTSCCST